MASRISSSCLARPACTLLSRSHHYQPYRASSRSSSSSSLSLLLGGARQAAASTRLTGAWVRTFAGSSRADEKKYTRDHEWIELDADGETGTIGISTYAAKALGDVVYVELPTLETEVDAGDTIGAVESVKSASDILTPVAGTIVEANGVLEETPGKINKSPEGDAWIARIRCKDVGEVEGLMSGEEYKAFTEE